ncbi:hypothetical protein QTV49_001757 [Vibrio vulnificus]|nr:hypothetical protein [Vibrio vulnificus]
MTENTASKIYLVTSTTQGRAKLVTAEGNDILYIGTGAQDSISALKMRSVIAEEINSQDSATVALKYLEGQRNHFLTMSSHAKNCKYIAQEIIQEIEYLRKIKNWN